MISRRRHSADEITSKLHQAKEMSQHGKRQAEIARKLGISVMTYHRWRARAAQRVERSPSIAPEIPHLIEPSELASKIDDLQLENARLRRLIIDLLLERRGLKRS
jgi:putative transposase